MPTHVIVVLCLCVASSTVFTVLSYKKTLANLYVKTASSMLFTLLGLTCLFTLTLKQDKIVDNGLIGGFLLMFALVLCLIGDIILGMPRISELKRDRMPVIVGGASFFALGHLTYCVALIILHGVSVWALVATIPLAIFYTFANKLFGEMDYKKLTAGVFVYSLLEGLALSVCVNALIDGYSLSKLLLTVGFTLFFISDMVLMHNYFGEKSRHVSVLCHATYYPAQILIALSILFIA